MPRPAGLIGAIAGDVIGSVHEHSATRQTRFPLFAPMSRFTDDTVLTVATADAILSGTPYDVAYRAFGRRHPNAGYGATFRQWMLDDSRGPYNSFGNGSAMRVSPVGLAFGSADEVLHEAERSAAVSHNHPEGIKGAQAVALAVFRARMGTSKADIRLELEERFQYDLSRRIADIRRAYSWDVSCQGSVPEAIIAFLDSASVEHAIRLAVSLGGDADTQAAIAGGMALAFYGELPLSIVASVRSRLTPDLLDVVDAFDARYPLEPGQVPSPGE
ncbi:MAG: ADP-ribosylglycohydrolase family protein [Vicinamibacterales bacterium]